MTEKHAIIRSLTVFGVEYHKVSHYVKIFFVILRFIHENISRSDFMLYMFIRHYINGLNV